MPAGTGPHPLDSLVPDPTGKPPICDESEVAELLTGMVTANQPRMFAVVQEYGERVDYRIAAWGMAFDDRATAIGVDDGMIMKLDRPEGALRGYNWGKHITAHLMWTTDEGAIPSEASGRQHCEPR